MRFGPFMMLIMGAMAVVFSVLAIRNNEHVLDTHMYSMGIEKAQTEAAGAIAPEVFISILLLVILGALFFMMKKKGKLDDTKKKALLGIGGVIIIFALFSHFSKEEPTKEIPVQTQTQPVQTVPQAQTQETVQPQVQKPAGAPPTRFDKGGWEEFDEKFKNFDEKFKNF